MGQGILQLMVESEKGLLQGNEVVEKKLK